ncbi:GNAT family N-acetyltransferase [Umezawaea beigongshangensis]|uniref:GNAT family N-acetyltransferase n=1 Tax=Umezawaea beigongshangensis TaxID=2780383 RepID=UPI0018F18F16|nr:GNAT family N-acetyltransferase [Umezawaea beigongshangensis]
MRDAVSTERLTLVRWAPEHRDHLLRLSRDERVTRYVRDGLPWPAEYARRRHEGALEHWERHGFGWRAVEETATGELIGVASAVRRDATADLPAGAVEIGWWVDPPLWGRGLATEIARALRDEAFRTGAPVVAARWIDGNTASGRVITRIGLAHLRSYRDEQDRFLHLHATANPRAGRVRS